MRILLNILSSAERGQFKTIILLGGFIVIDLVKLSPSSMIKCKDTFVQPKEAQGFRNNSKILL